MFLRRFTKSKANISMVLDKYDLSFGEELTGVVRVKAEEEFDAEEIRVSALCSLDLEARDFHLFVLRGN